jgi:hypothetical protein
MASRLRYLLRYGGEYLVGTRAKAVLSVFGPCKTLAEIKAAAAKVNGKVWVFREPRKVSRSRSRYKKICNYYGLGSPKKKIKLAPNHPGGNHVGNHPPVGQPVAAPDYAVQFQQHVQQYVQQQAQQYIVVPAGANPNEL